MVSENSSTSVAESKPIQLCKDKGPHGRTTHTYRFVLKCQIRVLPMKFAFEDKKNLIWSEIIMPSSEWIPSLNMTEIKRPFTRVLVFSISWFYWCISHSNFYISLVKKLFSICQLPLGFYEDICPVSTSDITPDSVTSPTGVNVTWPPLILVTDHLLYIK